MGEILPPTRHHSPKVWFPGFSAFAVPSTRPVRSLAFTPMYGSSVCAVITVSKPFLGTEAVGSNRSSPGPARTCQVATSVAPFQLTYSVTSSSDPCSVTRAGSPCGCPFHGKRKARYDSSSEGKLASKSSSPSSLNSEKYGSLPQPMNTLPLGNTCRLPWVSENILSG